MPILGNCTRDGLMCLDGSEGERLTVTMYPWAAQLTWILALLCLPEHLAKSCITESLNSTAIRIQIETFSKYSIDCLTPLGAKLKIKNNKIFESKNVNVHLEPQSLILSSDQRPESCSVTRIDAQGNRHSTNCLYQKSVSWSMLPDTKKDAVPEISSALSKTHDHSSSTVKSNRHQNTLLYVTAVLIFFLICLARKKIFKKKNFPCFKLCKSPPEISEILECDTPSDDRGDSSKKKSVLQETQGKFSSKSLIQHGLNRDLEMSQNLLNKDCLQEIHESEAIFKTWHGNQEGSLNKASILPKRYSFNLRGEHSDHKVV
ncbi:Hypothetical predicted protein [Pelobates cultripes]|uniref:Uncharacterized protein n=1 Tax=Pelobates cultripes TaxID=61616 RepID=A0AAD1T2Y7_PELCU|nr:Hypothetical predicted protein [Pelobates cultripes]